MIVPWHDPDEEVPVHDFDSQPGFFSGQVSTLPVDTTERRVRSPIGFKIRTDDLDIPVWWAP